MPYYYGYGFGFDSWFYIVILMAVVCMIAQGNVTSTFNKYSKVANSRGYTGADVAKMLLRQNGIYDVEVEHVRGNLTDHYDPVKKVLRLSDTVYGSKSVAALGVAAHETGHAVQHAKGYVPLTLRSAIFPVVNFSSRIAMPLFIIGLLIGSLINSYALALAGAILFGVVVAFQIITLPVEFNASSRALKMLEDYNYLDGGEVAGARKVLSAAAMTYVAAAAASLVQLLRLLSIIGVGRRND
ncbi:MAG: zinc metallopeptidase [Clostridia bacterium]|nr:zinc metallopeptidase [Clostridia bacterium]